jgi:hypothetical protein
MGDRLGWSPAQRLAEVTAVHARIEAEVLVLQEARRSFR